jgi:hypothetical protein
VSEEESEGESGEEALVTALDEGALRLRQSCAVRCCSLPCWGGGYPIHTSAAYASLNCAQGVLLRAALNPALLALCQPCGCVD